MEIIKFVQSFSTPFLDTFFQIITMIGEDYFFIAVLTLFLWCVNKTFAYRLGLICLLSAIVNVTLKEALHVARPIGEPGIRSLRVETATGYSFPSGHTQSTATFWITLMMSFRRAWVYVIGVVLIVLVALSRIYLGVYRPGVMFFTR